MIKLINGATGGDMWVSDDRVPEYLAKGCKLAVVIKKAEMPKKTAPKKTAPKKKTTTKKK